MSAKAPYEPPPFRPRRSPPLTQVPQHHLASTGISTTSTGYFGGNVGIGTFTPLRALELGGAHNASNGGPIIALYTSNGYANSRRFTVQNTLDGTSNYFNINLENDIGTVVRTPLTIRSSGNVGIGTTAPTSALQVSGTFTVSSTVTNANPALYVSTSGNVGIGTSAPGTALHVSGTLRVEGTSGIQVGTTSSMAQVIGADRNLYNLGGVVRSGSGSGLSFQTNAANVTYLHIPSGGNVGIGTTTPSGTLWVSGTVGMTRYSAVPFACSSGYAGLMAMTSTYKLCACDGSAWVYADSTGGACSW